jgi:hypothetical protein
LRQVGERFVRRDARLPGHRLHHVAQVVADIRIERKRILLVDRELRIDDDLRRIDFSAAAQTVTVPAGAVDAVERERARFQRRHRDAAFGTRHLFGVEALFAVDDRNHHKSVGELRREMHRIIETLLHALFNQQPVDDHLDCMVAAFVEFDLFVELANLAIDARPVES